MQANRDTDILIHTCALAAMKGNGPDNMIKVDLNVQRTQKFVTTALALAWYFMMRRLWFFLQISSFVILCIAWNGFWFWCSQQSCKPHSL